MSFDVIPSELQYYIFNIENFFEKIISLQSYIILQKKNIMYINIIYMIYILYTYNVWIGCMKMVKSRANHAQSRGGIIKLPLREQLPKRFKSPVHIYTYVYNIYIRGICIYEREKVRE